MAIKTVIYVCTSCGNNYEDIELATNCCPSVQAISGYACSGCDAVYVNKKEALQCCSGK